MQKHVSKAIQKSFLVDLWPPRNQTVVDLELIRQPPLVVHRWSSWKVFPSQAFGVLASLVVRAKVFLCFCFIHKTRLSSSLLDLSSTCPLFAAVFKDFSINMKIRKHSRARKFLFHFHDAFVEKTFGGQLFWLSRAGKSYF